MRQFDAVGMDKFIEAAETATQAIEDARPLLHRATELADQVKLSVPYVSLIF